MDVHKSQLWQETIKALLRLLTQPNVVRFFKVTSWKKTSPNMKVLRELRHGKLRQRNIAADVMHHVMYHENRKILAMEKKIEKRQKMDEV